MHGLRFKRVRAKSKDEAVAMARSLCRSCPCAVMSFAGVSWVEDGEEHTLLWGDIR